MLRLHGNTLPLSNCNIYWCQLETAVNEGGEAHVWKTQEADRPTGEDGCGVAAVGRRGNVGAKPALQRVCVRPRRARRPQVQPRKRESRMESAAQTRRSLSGLLPFLRGLPLRHSRYLLIARFVHRLRKRLQKCQRTFALRPFADKRSKPKS